MSTSQPGSSQDEIDAAATNLDECVTKVVMDPLCLSEDEDDDYYMPAWGGITASDYPAVLPEELDEDVVKRVELADAAEDSIIHSLLPPGCSSFDWRSESEAFQGQREVFSGTAGPTFPLSDLENPADAFLKIWDAEILDHIIKETNSYAEMVIRGAELHGRSRLKTWQPITREELLAFLAILIIQGSYPLPQESNYFYNSFKYVEMPMFKSIMTYNRYTLIKKFLQFAPDVPTDNSGRLETNGLTEHSHSCCDHPDVRKVQPVLDHLSRKFAELYLPDQDIALDESLFKWNGRLSFAQQLTTKAESGVRSYGLCDARTGYLWSFRVSTGKDSHQHARTVHDLVRPLFNKGHTIVLDNFLNSPLLSRCLKKNGTDTIGTLRMNRKYCPPHFINKKKMDIGNGDFLTSQCEDLSVTLWRDSSLVSMISTYHKPTQTGLTPMRPKHKLQVVVDYNKVMGSIDKKDQLLASYPMERSSKSRSLKLFRRLLNVSIVNSYIMHTCIPEYRTIRHRDFRDELCGDLIDRFKLAVPVVVQELVPLKKRKKMRPILKGNHFLEKGPSKMARCVWCTHHGRISRTVRQCDICLVPLCVESCFKEFHTRES